MTPRPNGFVRSKLPLKLLSILTKIEGLLPLKPNAFNISHKGVKYLGEKMENLVLDDEGKITFDYEGKSFSLNHSDITILKRIRCRKYLVKTNVLTEVVEPIEPEDP